jgi:hypothetical protein
MLNELFYLVAPLFLYVEFFQTFWRKDIYTRLKPEIFESLNPRVLLSFYVLKIFYTIWVIIGIFSVNFIPFLILGGLGIVKSLVVSFKNNFLINIYDLIAFLVASITLIFIFVQAISRLL